MKAGGKQSAITADFQHIMQLYIPEDNTVRNNHCGNLKFYESLLFCNVKCSYVFPRGDLAIALIVHYKDDPGKVARIIDKLLDREVHQLLKTPIVSSMYSSNPSTKSQVIQFEFVQSILNRYILEFIPKELKIENKILYLSRNILFYTLCHVLH